MMKLRWRTQVVKECRQCQHEQKTAERQLKTNKQTNKQKQKTKTVLFDSQEASQSESLFQFHFILGHSSLHLRDASLHVCIVKTAVSDQENCIEVAVCHHKKTGWRENEL